MNIKKSLTALLAAGVAGSALAGCAANDVVKPVDERLSVGIMLADDGLGDQSFNDTAFSGLMNARNQLDVSFNYREIKNTETYENGIEELIAEGNDLIVGVGFSIQPAIEALAEKYPEQKFAIIDGFSEKENVVSITFKEEEGSYLIGVLAGMKTKTNVIGFLGGLDVPLIHKFAAGFEAGAKKVNPDVKVIIDYAGTFGDDKKGESMAKEMISQNVDFLYPAAGFTGVGALKEAEKHGIYAFGVDSDQSYIAKKAIVSSMLKKVDSGLYQTIEDFSDDGEFETNVKSFGLVSDGVGIAPLSVLTFTQDELNTLAQIKQDIIDGKIVVPSTLGGGN